jgi:hypothetical protein
MSDETSIECQVLSTEMHKHCRRCDCPCHLTGGFYDRVERRPHSYPRETWARLGRYQRQERLRELREAGGLPRT